MALANERSIPHEPCMMMSSTVLSPQIPYSTEDFHKPPFEEKGGGTINLQPQQEPQSVINFSSFLTSSDQSLLSFEQKEEFYDGNSDQSYEWPHNNYNPRFSTGFNCFQTASDYGSISNCSSKGNQPSADGSYAWLYSESTVTTDSFEESGTQESAGINKRPHTGESTQAAKKQCTSNATNKKPKVQKPITPSKDPQSLAAKNRRERISERLKILQELVPNGSKVDLVTMLEKAISYVKFLQLQVKVLATDEFWPVQGGKAPDISQVREAIDAILSSSQRDRSSSTQ